MSETLETPEGMIAIDISSLPWGEIDRDGVHLDEEAVMLFMSDEFGLSAYTDSIAEIQFTVGRTHYSLSNEESSSPPPKMPEVVEPEKRTLISLADYLRSRRPGP